VSDRPHTSQEDLAPDLVQQPSKWLNREIRRRTAVVELEADGHLHSHFVTCREALWLAHSVLERQQVAAVLGEERRLEGDFADPASTGITPQPYVAIAATSRMSADSSSGTGTK
jgi:hypothetical protein